MAVLLGYLAWTLSTRDPSMARTTMILLWCAASLIAALNPSWQTSNDVLEEALRNAHMEESYKQAILHAAMQQRFLFPFGNPIHLGLFLSFSLLSFPALYSLTEKQERPLLWRTALIVTAIAQVYVLWGTRARTSLLAMAFAIGVMIVLWKGFNRRLLIGGLLGAFLVFFATLCTPAGREMLSRVETVRARAIYWEVALRMVRDHPFLGCGVGGFGDHYSRYRPLTPHQTEFPHQIFLETMTDWGAIGFLLFLFVLMRYGPRWWRGVRAKLKDQDTEGRLFVLWQVSVFAAFALAAQVGFPHNKVYLVGVAATILCLRPRGERDGQLASHVPKAQSIGWKPLWLLALIPLSILFCAREISQFQYEQGKSGFEKTGVTRGVYDLMLKSVRVWPPQWEAWYFA
ncbi:MAG: O-antigen ligase family protein, partial [Candidatus Omnitrophica bacterium]|nr:O-antigen ligase family protein [Candidatus Omnitrophota bacterium]